MISDHTDDADYLKVILDYNHLLQGERSTV